MQIFITVGLTTKNKKIEIHFSHEKVYLLSLLQSLKPSGAET